MNIEKLPSGSYRARMTIKGKVYRITLPYKPTEKELTILFADKLQNSSDSTGGTFLHYATKYIESRSNVVSPATIRTYNIKLNQFSNRFKSMNLFDIDNNDIQNEVNFLSKEHSAKTVKTTYGLIVSVFGQFRQNFKVKATLPMLKESLEYEPNTDEIKQILKLVKGTRYSVPFQLGVMGLRRGEICALTIDDLSGNKLHIHRDLVYNGKWILKETPKTESSNRTIVIPDSLAEEIRTQGFVYEGHPNALNKAIHRVQKELGIQKFKFHALRSYFASYAHALGIPDKDIMYIGGWETDSVMKSKYRKAMQESTEKSMSKIMKSII